MKSKCFYLASVLTLLGSLLFPGFAGADVEIGRQWATAAPRIDGMVSEGEWDGAVRTRIAHGQMRTMNDGAFLYVLLDVVDDNRNDAIGEDFYVLAFDVDLNLAVTPRVDLIYDACNDGRPFVKAFYLSEHSFTGCQPTSELSEAAPGFGGTLHSTRAHRFWEFKLDFAEIGVDPERWTTSEGEIPRVRVNVATISANPPFSTAQPDPNLFPNFSNAFQLDLAIAPAFPRGTAGPVFAGVGLVPSSYVDSGGYANIDIDNYYVAVDAPFGGKLNVFGNWENLRGRGAARYEVQYSKDGGPFTTLRQTWTNFLFNSVTRRWVPQSFGPDSLGRYPVPPASELWYLSDLLVTWRTPTFADGTYRLRLRLFNASGSLLGAPAGNRLTLFVDNTRPTPTINELLYDGNPVCECGVVNQGDGGFTFDISVTDPNGALDSFSLIGRFGNNRPTIPGVLYRDGYDSHRNEDGLGRWNGVENIVVPESFFQATQTCAHTFILRAGSRIQNGYARLFQVVDYVLSATIVEGGDGSITGCESGDTLSGRLSVEPSALDLERTEVAPDAGRKAATAFSTAGSGMVSGLGETRKR